MQCRPAQLGRKRLYTKLEQEIENTHVKQIIQKSFAFFASQQLMFEHSKLCPTLRVLNLMTSLFKFVLIYIILT